MKLLGKNRKQKGILFLFSLMSSYVWAEKPSPSEWGIQDFHLSGDGCSNGSASVLVTDALENGINDFFEVIYDHFIIESGLEENQPKKNCMLKMKLRTPKGWQFSLSEVEYHGFANIAQDAKGIVTSRYRVNRDIEAIKKLKFQGPFLGDFTKTDRISFFEDRDWTPCSHKASLTINTLLSIKGKGLDPSMLTLDSNSGFFSQKWKVNWQRCKPDTKPSSYQCPQGFRKTTNGADLSFCIVEDISLPPDSTVQPYCHYLKNRTLGFSWEDKIGSTSSYHCPSNFRKASNGQGLNFCLAEDLNFPSLRKDEAIKPYCNYLDSGNIGFFWKTKKEL